MDISRRTFIGTSAFFAVGAIAPAAFAARSKGEETYVPPPTVKCPLRALAEPVLQAPAEDSMGIAWAVNGLSNGAIEFADNPEMKNARTVRCGGFGMSAFDDQALLVRLEGLAPATRYWYRTVTTPIATYRNAYNIQLGETQVGAIRSFTTLGAGARSHFCMISDTHANWKVFAPAAEKVAALKPAAVVWNGDATNTTEDKATAVQIFLDPKIARKDWAAETPLLFLDGNHDYRGKWIGHLDEVMMPRLPSERDSRFWQLKRNFALRLGDIALIGLETGEDKPDWHPKWMGLANFDPYRRAQTEWLRQALAREDIRSARYLIAFCHIPLFDADPEANPGNVFENWADWQKDCADQWGPLLSAAGCQLVIVGHKHHYRFDPAAPGRTWAQIVGGGPGRNEWNFPTVVEGKVADGELKIVVHRVDRPATVGEFTFKPRA